MRASKTGSARQAFTLLEIVLAITVMTIVFGLTIPFFHTQVKAMNAQASRADAHQNARFGVSVIERELRVAGAGMPGTQPMIVQADPYAVTFNVDLVSNSRDGSGNFGAVYFDPDMPDGATVSMDPSSQIFLPRSEIPYPDSNYYMGGTLRSFAETISFWIGVDTSVGNDGSYALYRRVNNLPPSVVARGLVISGEDPPTFRYLIADDRERLVEIPEDRLPAFHTAIHGGPQDIGLSALTDSIKMVTVFLRTRVPGGKVGKWGVEEKATYRQVEASVRLLNSGLLHHATCGEAPVFGQSVDAKYDSVSRNVIIKWSRAVDEAGGEKDVDRYVIFRRSISDAAFTNPHTSIGAGESTYVFHDAAVSAGRWIYGVAAQDCGGQYSPVASSVVVDVPDDD